MIKGCDMIIQGITDVFIPNTVFDIDIFYPLKRQGQLKNIMKNNAIGAFTYTLTLSVLQEKLNKENDFAKQLYFTMISRATSTIVVDTFCFNKNGFKILASIAISLSSSFFIKIYNDWEKGGRDFLSQKFNSIYKQVSESRIPSIISGSHLSWLFVPIIYSLERHYIICSSGDYIRFWDLCLHQAKIIKDGIWYGYNYILEKFASICVDKPTRWVYWPNYGDYQIVTSDML